MAPPFTLSTEEAVGRARERDPTLRAFVHTRFEDALADAAGLSKEAARSAVHGVPFSLKDEWETVCLPTTGGSWRHRERRSERDSAVFQVFRDAGAVLVGKSNLSDMGLPPEATSYVGGSTRNPFDSSRTAGGSSGGAAAAVAERLVAFDWGTDIGGSIRLPAAFCGVFGMRLSSETWPITDLFPSVPASLELMCGQGPLTRTIAEMRAVLEVARPLRKKERPFSATSAVIYPPDPAGRWPTFADDVRPIVARAFGEVSTDHGLPSPRHVRNAFSAIWASHFEELFDSDPTVTPLEGAIAVASSLVLRGLFGDRRIHPSTAGLLALIALGRYTIFRSKTRANDAARAIRERFAELWDRGIVVVAPRLRVSTTKDRPLDLERRSPELDRRGEHRGLDRARDSVRNLRRPAPQPPAHGTARERGRPPRSRRPDGSRRGSASVISASP